MNPQEQQHVRGYEGSQAYEQPRSRDSYGPGVAYDDEFMDAFAQRLEQRLGQGTSGKIGTEGKAMPGQGERLALAIVSIAVVGFIAFFALLSSSWGTFMGFSLLILGFVAVAAFLINAAYNRWWFR